MTPEAALAAHRAAWAEFRDSLRLLAMVATVDGGTERARGMAEAVRAVNEAMAAICGRHGIGTETEAKTR